MDNEPQQLCPFDKTQLYPIILNESIMDSWNPKTADMVIDQYQPTNGSIKAQIYTFYECNHCGFTCLFRRKDES